MNEIVSSSSYLFPFSYVMWINLWLQGALDGGLDIPHSDKRFAGFSKDSKQLDAEVHRKYIYGGHVAAYMGVSNTCGCARTHVYSCVLTYWFFTIQTLMEDEPEKFQTHFSRFIKKGIESDGIEEMYKKVHAAIRADPTPKKLQKEPPKEHKR